MSNKKNFIVSITETLRKEISVVAGNQEEAQQIVEDLYSKGEIVLIDEIIDCKIKVEKNA